MQGNQRGTCTAMESVLALQCRHIYILAACGYSRAQLEASCPEAEREAVEVVKTCNPQSCVFRRGLNF